MTKRQTQSMLSISSIYNRFLYFCKKKEKHRHGLFDKKDEKWEISNIFILILQTKLRARA